MNYETSAEIELAVAKYFDPRRNVIVPNVWWGLNLNHECDLFVLTKTGYAYEIEIKTSKSDIKADLKKRHSHNSKWIRKLYFAIPEKLNTCIDFIPERAGVLMVCPKGTVIKKREAKQNNFALKLSDKTKFKLVHLGMMRIWALKADIIRFKGEHVR